MNTSTLFLVVTITLVPPGLPCRVCYIFTNRKHHRQSNLFMNCSPVRKDLFIEQNTHIKSLDLDSDWIQQIHLHKGIGFILSSLPLPLCLFFFLLISSASSIAYIPILHFYTFSEPKINEQASCRNTFQCH